MEPERKKEMSLRKPYENMIKQAKKAGNYRVIEGEELEKARHRINSTADKNILKIENLERQASIKSSNWIIK